MFSPSLKSGIPEVDRIVTEIADAINTIQSGTTIKGGNTSVITTGSSGSGGTYTFAYPLSKDVTDEVSLLYNSAEFQLNASNELEAQAIVLGADKAFLTWDETNIYPGTSVNLNFTANSDHFNTSGSTFTLYSTEVLATAPITTTNTSLLPGTGTTLGFGYNSVHFAITANQLTANVMTTPTSTAGITIGGTWNLGSTNITIGDAGDDLDVNSITLEGASSQIIIPNFTTDRMLFTATTLAGDVVVYQSDNFRVDDTSGYLAVGDTTTIPTLAYGLNIKNGAKFFGYHDVISETFSSGWGGTGYRLKRESSSGTTLELDNLWVRGTLNVYELVINQVRATNGSLFVTSAAKVESVSGSAGSETIAFEDPSGHDVSPFAVDDLIICQRVSLDNTTIVKRIVRKVASIDATHPRIITVGTVADGPSDSGAIEQGDVFARFGSVSDTDRQGVVYLSSDDADSPFVDILDGVSSWADWTDGSKLKARLGKLDGISTSGLGSLSGYGLFSTNVYLDGGATNAEVKVIGNIWALTGGFGGSASSPAVSIDEQGIFIESYSPATVNDDGVFIGSYVVGGTNFYGTIINSSGLFGYQNDKLIFRLPTSTSTSAYIGGFNFIKDKIYNGDFRIEATSSLSGLAYQKTFTFDSIDYDVDVVKVGDFSLAPDSSADYVVSDHRLNNPDFDTEPTTNYWHVTEANNYSAITAVMGTDQYTNSTGTYYFSGAGKERSIQWEGGTVAATTNNESEIYQSLWSGSSPTYPNMSGEKVTIKFKIRRDAYNSSSEAYQLTYRLLGSTVGTIISDTYYTSDFTDGEWQIITLTVDMPTLSSSETLIWYFKATALKNQTAVYDPLSIDYLKITTHREMPQTLINDDGILLYNNANSYLKFSADGIEGNINDLTISNAIVSRWLGRFKGDPSQYESKEGDMYYNIGSSVVKVYTNNSWVTI